MPAESPIQDHINRWLEAYGRAKKGLPGWEGDQYVAPEYFDGGIAALEELAESAISDERLKKLEKLESLVRERVLAGAPRGMLSGAVYGALTSLLEESGLA